MNSITKIELPATSKDLLAQCETIRPRTLYFSVWDLHFKLYDDAKYRKYLNAYTRDMTVEGSIAADEFMAARTIRDEAERQDNLTIQSATINDIMKALRRVMKDSRISRKERREMAEAADVAAAGAGDGQ